MCGIWFASVSEAMYELYVHCYLQCSALTLVHVIHALVIIVIIYTPTCKKYDLYAANEHMYVPMHAYLHTTLHTINGR